MTRFNDNWEDPVRPEMFSPTDEQVDSILDLANREPISEKAPRRKIVMAAAILAFTMIACALGIRSLETLWGARVLPQGYSAQAPGEAAMPESGVIPEPMTAQAPQAAAGDASRSSMAAASTQAPQASQATPGTHNDEAQTLAKTNGGAASSSAPSADTSSVSGMAGTALPTPESLCASADVIVAGNFDGGVFSVEEALKGECPAAITVGRADSLRGWAVLFLNESDGGLVFSQEPYLFRTEGGRLAARDASGAPMEEFTLANGDITLDTLRALCGG